MNELEELEMKLKSNAENYSSYSNEQINILYNQTIDDLYNITFELSTLNYIKAKRLENKIKNLIILDINNN